MNSCFAYYNFYLYCLNIFLRTFVLIILGRKVVQMAQNLVINISCTMILPYIHRSRGFPLHVPLSITFLFSTLCLCINRIIKLNLLQYQQMKTILNWSDVMDVCNIIRFLIHFLITREKCVGSLLGKSLLIVAHYIVLIWMNWCLPAFFFSFLNIYTIILLDLECFIFDWVVCY